jgi:hypothetical protein
MAIKMPHGIDACLATLTYPWVMELRSASDRLKGTDSSPDTGRERTFPYTETNDRLRLMLFVALHPKRPDIGDMVGAVGPPGGLIAGGLIGLAVGVLGWVAKHQRES